MEEIEKKNSPHLIIPNSSDLSTTHMQRIGKGHISLDSFLSPNEKEDVESGTQKMNFATHESMCQ